MPYPTVYETRDGGAATATTDRAVVPIENSLEGGVAATLDALAARPTDVRIVAEVVHPIHHCLIAARRLALGEIERVLSHPQATAQCARFLRERLPGAELVAGHLHRRGRARWWPRPDEPWAALGRALAAELYGCERAGRGRRGPRRQRDPLRLAGAGAADEPPSADGAATKTSIVFWGFGDESPGCARGGPARARRIARST